jgi:HSP20 family molecular chaperone IbpA
MRAFRLPEDADLEKIDARFDHGMLNIKVARLAGSKPQATKTIQVK